MNTTRLQDSQTLAAAINAANTRRSQRAESAANLIVALVVGVLGGLALLHYATPCLGGALC